MRFAMTARTLAKQREEGLDLNEITALNVRKVTRFRPDGQSLLEQEVRRVERERRGEDAEKEEADEQLNDEEYEEALRGYEQKAGRGRGDQAN